MMIRFSWIAIVGLVTPVLQAADSPNVIGTWTGEVDGLVEVWTIAYENDAWSVRAFFLDKGKEVGACRGVEVKAENAGLIFTQLFVTKPNKSWPNGSLVSVKPSGNALQFEWRGDSTGKRILTRAGASFDQPQVKMADPKMPDPKKQPAVAAAGDELIGVWYCAVEGLHEGWIVSRSKDGKWSVKAEYRDPKTEKIILGAFIGKDPEYKDGRLVSQMVYLKKPKAHWLDSATIILERSGDKLKYTWEAGGSRGSREMVRSKEKF